MKKRLGHAQIGLLWGLIQHFRRASLPLSYMGVAPRFFLLLRICRNATKFALMTSSLLPWVPEIFLACGGNFRCWPKADTSSAVGRSHEQAKPRAGEAARKTSGTERCFLPSPLTFALFYRITFTPIRLKVSDCDHVGRHVKKCPKTHIILSKTSWSLKFIALRAIMTGSHRSSP